MAKRRRRRKAAPTKRRKRRSTGGKRRARRKKRTSGGKRRARRKKRTGGGKRRKRRARRSARSSHRSRRRKPAGTPSHEMVTVRIKNRTQRGYAVKSNPGRRRRRRRSSGRRSHRRGLRRYASRRRGYRRNPGGMLLDLAKRALPALGGFYLTRVVVAKVGPMLDSLGAIKGPVVAAAAVFGLNIATTKVAFLAKHRTELMLGAGVSLLDQVITAFAPASVKAMVGLSDYVQMGDYIGIGATPLNDRMTLSDYVAVGGDGVEEELGLEEELGVEEELGNDMLGGVAGGSSLLAPVPTKSFVAPIPTRSFTMNIPKATTAYDNPSDLYGGIFNGGFGR